jgi:hypothetical protein
MASLTLSILKLQIVLPWPTTTVYGGRVPDIDSTVLPCMKWRISQQLTAIKQEIPQCLCILIIMMHYAYQPPLIPYAFEGFPLF